MNNKDRKAKNSLIKHRNKLDSPADFDSAWVSKLSDLLREYIGPESLLHKSAKGWYSIANRGNVSHMKDCVKILENAVEFIEDNGVKKESSFWRTLEKTNGSVIATVAFFIVNIIFFSGYYIADYQKVKSNFEILVENEKLKDSLSTMRKTLKMTKNETKLDMTVDKKSGKNERNRSE